VGRIPRWTEPILARGLETLHALGLADSYDDRYNILSPKQPKYETSPKRANQFLDQALLSSNDSDDDVLLREYTEVDERAHIHPPFFRDPDLGPSNVWRWAHLDERCCNFVQTTERRQLRKWGYVMWDQSRLDLTSIQRSPFEEPPEEPPSDDQMKREAERSKSLGRRHQIYVKGGRGWWSFEDEAKIVWTKANHPRSRSRNDRSAKASTP
jgi:hypothetical protein